MQQAPSKCWLDSTQGCTWAGQAWPQGHSGAAGTHLVRGGVEGEQGAGPVLPPLGLVAPVHVLGGRPLQQRGQQRVSCQVPQVEDARGTAASRGVVWGSRAAPGVVLPEGTALAPLDAPALVNCLCAPSPRVGKLGTAATTRLTRAVPALLERLGEDFYPGTPLLPLLGRLPLSHIWLR